jgi:hypothetical protein
LNHLIDDHMRASDVGTVLAAILSASSRPLTRILEDLSGTQLAIKVLADGERGLTERESFRLTAGGITRCRWRHGLLIAADGTVAASTSLVWLEPRLPFDACQALAEAAEPAGVILGRYGMRRTDRRAMATTGIEEVTGRQAAVISTAVLEVGGGLAVGYAEETITRQFAEALAS